MMMEAGREQHLQVYKGEANVFRWQHIYARLETLTVNFMPVRLCDSYTDKVRFFADMS